MSREMIDYGGSPKDALNIRAAHDKARYPIGIVLGLEDSSTFVAVGVL